MNFGADIKILIVGSTNTGKTSFVQRYTTGTFLNTYNATIISEYKYKILNINNNIYRIHLWDLGGQDKNVYISKLLIKDCNGIIIFSDIMKKNSIDEMLNWKNFLINYYDLTVFKEKTPIFGVYNKIDLLDSNNKIEIENFVDKFIENKNFENNFKTSVKDNINIEETMNFLINRIIELFNENNNKNNNKNNKNNNKNNKNNNNNNINGRESIIINKNKNNFKEKKNENCC